LRWKAVVGQPITEITHSVGSRGLQCGAELNMRSAGQRADLMDVIVAPELARV
jgi:hypothetical protein